MKNNIIIVGADIEIIELVEENPENRVVGVIDEHRSGKYYGYPVLGTDADVSTIKADHPDAIVSITLDNPEVKEKLFTYYKTAGFEIATLVSQQAMVSRHASIQTGAIIQKGVNVGPNSDIGIGVKVNVCANVMHDVTIGSFATIAPNAVLLGYVKIGGSTFIGANATILPSVKIEEKITVGAGAIVTKDLNSAGVYIGSPARLKR